jgi:hypothetical protein
MTVALDSVPGKVFARPIWRFAYYAGLELKISRLATFTSILLSLNYSSQL